MSQTTTCPYCNSRFASPVCCTRSSRRGGGLISGLFKTVLLYVGLVFASGTLINTGHPVAVESGRLIQTVTFVEPAIRWTQSHGYGLLAHGLQSVASGYRFS